MVFNATKFISSAVGKTTAERGFGMLFSKAKSTLDSIQKVLAGLPPSMPGMPVAKFGDLSIGIDVHPTVTPPAPTMPVPHVGKVYDLMADIMAAAASALPKKSPDGLMGMPCGLMKGMAPSVKVHGQWIAQAGVSIVHLPAFVLHPVPLVSGMSESEMWMGSSTVLADGGPCSTLTHPALSCNIVGFPSVFRKGKPKKPAKAMLAPTAMLSTITSAGKPVLVGGPPTIDLFQLAMTLGLKGMGKLWKKTGGKFQGLLDRLVKKKEGKNPLIGILKDSKSNKFGEPVDAATGRVYHTNTDFQLSGPIPIIWERTYYSDAAVDGSLGYNWHHSYNMGIRDLDGEAFLLRHATGRESGLPVLKPGDSHYDRKEQLLWTRDKRGYLLTDAAGLRYHFEGSQNRAGYRMLSGISTKDGFSVRLNYGPQGRLSEIITSRGETLKVSTDERGRVLCVSTRQEDEVVNLVRYRYDGNGDLVETTDPLDVSKHFIYAPDHLLVQLTNQSGMSFHWEYEGKGGSARCVHTWGDDGVMEYRVEYKKGLTRARDGEGAVTEYHYGSDKLIYKIVDANGGVTRRHYNEYQELDLTVNPEGYTRKTDYDDYGHPLQIKDENGGVTYLGYDDRHNLTSLRTPGGKSLRWEYDDCDRVAVRITASGEKISYAYEGGTLKTITDGKGRVYTLAFNERFDLEELRFPNGLTRRWEYDLRGRLTQATDVKGNLTRYAYDRADNLIRLEEPDGNTHHFEYDAMGNMTHAKDNLREVGFTYGALGVLKSRTQNRRTVSYGYDSELRLKRVGNESGEQYRFALDGLGQVIAETGFDGLRRTYERDSAGRVTRVERPGEKWTRYTYDGLDNILKEEQFDGATFYYVYDKDGLLKKAANDNSQLEFIRDSKTGRVTEEKQGGHSVCRTYDKEGNCTRITSSLGADIRHTYDEQGNLRTMQAGEDWQASWLRDNTGLELQRTLSGGVNIHTGRDRFGRVTGKSVRTGNIEKGNYRYQWGIANRLLSKENELTGVTTRYDYDEFDFLIREENYQGYQQLNTIYRAPDRIGNLFETPDRKDRKYSASGRLEEDENHFYHYDDEGNLIYKELRQLQEGIVNYDRREEEEELGIRFKSTGTGWRYDWQSNGMLKQVTRPDKKAVLFKYDPLGRRTEKIFNRSHTFWVWDGNVPLHEWKESLKITKKDTPKEAPEVTTWVFEEGTFIPAAKIQGDKRYSIVTDYLGTPIQMYDELGNKNWDCTLDVYGKATTFEGSSLSDCPFRYQGQYEDQETGLYYNRFRYYSPELGKYISQDPIRIKGGESLYQYVNDLNLYIDIYGLFTVYHGTSASSGQNIKQNGIDLSRSRGKLDFDPSGSGGFYTSDSLEDTIKYNKRIGGQTDIIQIDIPDAELANMKIKVFENADAEWADFVTKGRQGTLVHDYDIVIGPKLANPDDVLAGIEPPKAIKKQKQIVFTSDKAAQLASKHINH